MKNNIYNNIMIKDFIIILIIFLVIDLPVILGINGKMYRIQFLRINKEPMKINNYKIMSAFFAYILLAFSIYWFVIKEKKGVIDGMLLGLVIYGIYNGTNMTTINEWGWKEFIVDTLWGTFLGGLITLTYSYIIKFNIFQPYQ